VVYNGGYCTEAELQRKTGPVIRPSIQPERTDARVSVYRVRDGYLTRTENLRGACVLHVKQSGIILAVRL
jgi:hypothetical protein